MSEYQYYEFLALDKPLTGKQRAELRSISTRAEITATRFVNEYQWGDLKDDPRKMMERYFDAFLYLANWGTRHLMFRLPRGVLDAETAELYCYRFPGHRGRRPVTARRHARRLRRSAGASSRPARPRHGRNPAL